VPQIGKLRTGIEGGMVSIKGFVVAANVQLTHQIVSVAILEVR